MHIYIKCYTSQYINNIMIVGKVGNMKNTVNNKFGLIIIDFLRLLYLLHEEMPLFLVNVIHCLVLFAYKNVLI